MPKLEYCGSKVNKAVVFYYDGGLELYDQ